MSQPQSHETTLFLILSIPLAQCRAWTSAWWLAAWQSLHMLLHASLLTWDITMLHLQLRPDKLSPAWGYFYFRTFPSAFSSKALQALSGLPSGEGPEHPSLSFISRGRREQREGRSGRSCRVLGVVLGLQARPED